MINQTCLDLGANRSVIRELFEYGRARAQVVGQENIFDFSLGNPSIPAPPEIREAVLEELDTTEPLKLHGYTSAAGDPEFRRAVAEDLNRRFGADASPEDIFVTCGAAPGLTAILRALAVPGREVLAMAPFFPEYRPFAQAAGLGFRVVPPEIPSFRINFSALESMLTADTAAIILNSPNNPSGVVYPEETLRHLAELLTEKSRLFGHPIYLISDEPYRELVYDGVSVPWIPHIYPNTIVCYSWSKSLSLPGERIGYVYVPRSADQSRELFTAIAGAARISGHVCAPSIWQRVVGRCIALGPDLASYDENRRALYHGLIDAGYQVAPPQGAFYLFVQAPGGDAAAFSEKAKEKDLLIVPGDSFGCPGWFRLCYCVSYDTIQRSLPLFRELMER